MQQDITLTGDSKNKIWRPFKKQLFTDGGNDYLKTIELTQDLRVGKSFSISLWVEFLSFTSGIFSIPTCVGFYAQSSNNILTSSREINEINIYAQSNNSLTVVVLARIGNADAPNLPSNSGGGFAAVGGGITLPILLNKKYHIVITNNFDGANNLWAVYVNSIKLLQGNTVFIANLLPPPPATGIVLPPDPNYISGIGFLQNRNNLVTGYTNSKVNELIITKNVLTDDDVRKLYHCGAGNYANYPTSIMTNQLVHLPMNEDSDFIYDGINLKAKDISTGGTDAIITGQGTSPTLSNFYP